MKTPKKLLSHDACEVLSFLEKNQITSPKEIGLWAWVANRWLYWNDSDRYHRICTSPTYFQCNQQGWRAFTNHTEEIRNEIFLKIKSNIEKYLPEQEALNMLSAGKIFHIAYPRWVSVGNGDTKGYDEDVSSFWDKFKPYKQHFEEILGLIELLDNEWITTAQVMWEHYRWVGDRYEDHFSKEAAGYFLEKAIELHPSQPIHYIILRDKKEIRPHYDKPPTQTDKFTKLQSQLGLTYLYYAQYQYFHNNDLQEAYTYYLQFIESEPDLLPDNIFRFYAECAYERMYPPSIQLALTELAKICIEKNWFEEAEQHLLQAIHKRKDNFQAPYQVLADLKYQQGYVQEAISLLEQKIEVWTLSEKKTYFEVFYEPQHNQYYSLEGNHYTRIKVVFLHDYLMQMAYWCWDTKEYAKAQKCYKRLRLLLDNQEYVSKVKYVAKIDFKSFKIEILEKQMELAFILKDYWQALSIFEQIKVPSEKSQAIKDQIKTILKY